MFELEAVIFDLDGVVTRTADLHAAAWKEVFDEFLARHGGGSSESFDVEVDYLAYVDGRPRYEGVRRFLASRDIELPDGDPDGGTDGDTVAALGLRKNEAFLCRLRRDGVAVYTSTLALIDELRRHGVRSGLVTSSRNGREILELTDTTERFDAVVDGADLAPLDLRGKPHPDTFVRCAKLLEVTPSHAAVVEDASAGVAAARRGSFGLVVGVARHRNREALAAHADLVVGDLGEIDARALERRFRERRERAAWRVEQEGFDPAREHAMESLFTVGNGYMGVRGSPDILPGGHGDLFIAGIYDRKHAERPYSEHEFLNLGGDSLHAELVSAPFPFRQRVWVDGHPADPGERSARSFRRVLDLRSGVLHTELQLDLDGGRRATVATRRCASADQPHLLLQELTVQVDRGAVAVDASLEDVELATNHPHLVALPVIETDDADLYRYRTRASDYEICIATRVTMTGSDRHALRWLVQNALPGPLVLRRYVVVYTSRDGVDPVEAALADIRARRWDAFDQAFAAHTRRWHDTWDRSDLVIRGGCPAEQAFRFNAYHLHSTAAREPFASIGARALSGRAYEGHVFWDVEVFMLPFFIHTAPAAARNALQYRHHTLAGARERARELGYDGACYAWESTVTGEDVTPRMIRLKTTGREIPIFTGTEQIHVTADVAYGVWRYWDATHDHAFLRDFGCEILFETARFWRSRVSAGNGRHHIRGVVGPDEYHHTVDDNAYTNWMARFNLEQAVWAAAWLDREHADAARELRGRLALGADEPRGWAALAQTLHCPGPNADGVIEQFAGFFELEDYPLPAEELLQAPVHRLFDWDRINRLKLIKQADMLMLPFLFPRWFDDATLAANYRYYEPLTDHGSSLSPAVHAALAARLGLHDAARRYLRQSLWLDLSNVMTNSALGVHPACMGGTWQALVFGFLGVQFGDDGPHCAPDAAARLPQPWRAVALELLWRGRAYPVETQR